MLVHHRHRTPKVTMSDPKITPPHDVEAWLTRITEPPLTGPLHWAPYGYTQASDWVRVRSAEHLAVLASRASRPDNNVCFVSSTPAIVKRTVNLIGLVSRRPLAWAVVINDHCRGSWAADVHHPDYPHGNYEGFSALSAAQIAAAWVTTGVVPQGLTFRLRST